MTKRSQLRDVCFLAQLAARAKGIEQKQKMLAVAGPFPLLSEIMRWLNQELRDESRKFQLRTQLKVNGNLPLGYMLWRPELRFWVAGSVCYRLVASGWRPPAVPVAAAFVQALYAVGETYNIDPPPDAAQIELVIRMPDRLRKQGLFLCANS